MKTLLLRRSVKSRHRCQSSTTDPEEEEDGGGPRYKRWLS